MVGVGEGRHQAGEVGQGEVDKDLNANSVSLVLYS